jgi:hypothetical protein
VQPYTDTLIWNGVQLNAQRALHDVTDALVAGLQSVRTETQMLFCELAPSRKPPNRNRPLNDADVGYPSLVEQPRSQHARQFATEY